MFPRLEWEYACLAALLAHLCGPWILPGQTEMYLGVYNGNVLHNMTLLFSRTPVPLVLLFFFRLWDSPGRPPAAYRLAGPCADAHALHPL